MQPWKARRNSSRPVGGSYSKASSGVRVFDGQRDNTLLIDLKNGHVSEAGGWVVSGRYGRKPIFAGPLPGAEGAFEWVIV